MAIKKRQKTLSHGRPPVLRPSEHMSSHKSRTVIRTHHRLEKQRATALKNGDVESAEALTRAIENNGGLKLYQAASKQGQSKERGGDSSKVLVEWLRQDNVIQNTPADSTTAEFSKRYRCLEVGALSTQNEISKVGEQIMVSRIDLNSQGSGITKQDFMERPLPKDPDELFDIISLSLVLNYVPEAVQRGDMLKRVPTFLRTSDSHAQTDGSMLPALFLVLPLPCVQNSRYLDEQLLLRIMTNMGFDLTKKKLTPKLCYYLFTLRRAGKSVKTEKRKVRDGKSMNNFCIVVE